MKHFFYRQNSKRKDESGQSALEFAIVLPIFLLILAMVLDYGWLFYVKMGTENAARNAARVACVEYTDVSQNPLVKLPDVDVSSDYQKEYTLDEIGALDDYNNQILTDEENDILSEVKNTLPPSVTDVKVYIKYTYDETYLKSNATSYDVKNRSNGDVIITVTGTHHALTPLVNWEAKSNRMLVGIKCQSVYKVEKIA